MQLSVACLGRLRHMQLCLSSVLLYPPRKQDVPHVDGVRS